MEGRYIMEQNSNEQNTTVLEGTWYLDTAHSWVGLSVQYAGVVKVQACFRSVDAILQFDSEGIATVDAIAEANSFDSGNQTRDDHVRSPDFLHVDAFSIIEFNGTAQERQLQGMLTLHGVSRNVVFTVQNFQHTVDATGAARIGAAAQATISRKEFGLTWNNVLRDGSLLLSDTVALQLHVSFVQANVDQDTNEFPPVTYHAQSEPFSYSNS